jgi:diguanylate cyclase (GGDEF)-like protein
MATNQKPSEFNPEVSRLRRQVRELCDTARHNEEVHNRFQEIELALLAAQDFYVIADYLQHEFRQTIGLDAVSLVLVDNRDEIKNAICTSGEQQCPEGILLVSENKAKTLLAGAGGKPALVNFNVDEHEWMFRGRHAEEGSLAILPFVRRERTIGCLALYRRDAEHYQPDSSTVLLQRLGAVTAICVENCLNYERLRRMGLTDVLTGLANRRELEKRMTIEVSRSLRDAQSLSCLYLDIDHFKQVNDNYGHDVGDMTLQKVAAVMVEAVRLGDVVARFGGEEFVILLPGISGSIAMETAERIRQAVENSSMEVAENKHLEITISIGMASFVPAANMIADIAEISEQILTRADHALIQAKQQGRNRVVVAD